MKINKLFSVYTIQPISIFSSIFILASATHAQSALKSDSTLSAENNKSADNIENVHVIGTSFQNKQEIEQRRNSVIIVDSISRDDIGVLPDLTIAETMRRITGVTTIYNDDIGQFASVRGVHPDYVPVTLNGLSIATTGDLGEGTRKVNLQVIPGKAVKTLQAFKSPTPELDIGALGGLLNIVTLSAFDENLPKFSLTAGTSYSSYMDVPDDNARGSSKDSPLGYSADFMWAPRFGDNEEFGVVLTGFYSTRPRTQSNLAVTNRIYYNNEGGTTTPESDDWNGFAAPNSFVSHNYTNRFDKIGGTANLEFKPSEYFSTNIFAYGYFTDEEETRNTNRLLRLNQHEDLSEYAGTAQVRSAETQWRFNSFVRDQYGLQWSTESVIGERGQLTTNVGYSYAFFETERPFVAFRYNPNLRFSYDLADRSAPFTLDDPENFIDPANYTSQNHYFDIRSSEEGIFEARADYSINSNFDDRGFGFKAGVNLRNLDLERDDQGTRYETGVPLGEYSFVPDFAPPGYYYPSLWLRADDFYREVVPTIGINEAGTDELQRINDYSFVEDTLAAYGSVNYSTDNWRIDTGLRADHTEFTAKMAQVVDGELQDDQTSKEGSNSNVLPYLSAMYSITPELRLKASLSKTIGRANPEATAVVENIDEEEMEIIRGNADIKPLKSNNIDLGVEYFFNDSDGMLTVTLFRKSISDDILTISNTQTIDGLAYQVTQPVNGETTEYQGVEVGFINNSLGNLANWLAPVGVSANMVQVDGSSSFYFQGEKRERDLLQYQSDVAANASIFYGFNNGSEIRLAANHQGEYVESYAASPWLDLYIKPYTTYDLTARWALSESFQLVLEGRNITSENRQRNTGLNGEYHRAELEVGSTWYLRATYKY